MTKTTCASLLTLAALSFLLVTPARAAKPRAVPVVPPLPAAEPITDERLAELDKAYGEATQRYEAGDLEGALKRATVVYKINPNPSTVLLRAQLLGELKRPCKAFAALLPGMDMKPAEDERAELEDGLSRHGKACNKGYGWTRLQVLPSSATVKLAGVKVPLDRTVGLPAGSQSLELTAPGHARLRTTLDVRTGEAAVARYELSPVPAPVAVPAPPVQPRPTPAVTPHPTEQADIEDSGSSSTLGWVLTGSGVALLGGAAAMTVLALDAKDEGNSYKSPKAGMTETERKDRYEQAQSDMKTRGVVAVALLATGAVATIWGLVDLLGSGAEETSAWTLGPAWTPAGAGLTLRGGF
jgi:hypothetical protein